jgi:hypothetical protein
MAALSSRRPNFPLSMIALGAATALALLAFGMGEGPPSAKDRPQASRPVAFGGLVSRPLGVTGPATFGERLHAVPRLPAWDEREAISGAAAPR